MEGTRRDYKSYLLRMYREQNGGETTWRATLQSPQSGERLHFSRLSALLGFLASDGDLERTTDAHARAERATAGDDGPRAQAKRGRLFRWLGLGLVVLGYVLLPLAGPVAISCADGPQGTSGAALPPGQQELVEGLLGTTEQAERIAKAIQSGDIKVFPLGAKSFQTLYEYKGGHRSPMAFAQGNEVYLRTDSPTMLSDLVHEGTHALDYLSGLDVSQRKLELRAYWQEREFQKATGAPLGFKTVAAMLMFIYRTY
jgi:hypothetical protein